MAVVGVLLLVGVVITAVDRTKVSVRDTGDGYGPPPSEVTSVPDIPPPVTSQPPSTTPTTAAAPPTTAESVPTTFASSTTSTTVPRTTTTTAAPVTTSVPPAVSLVALGPDKQPSGAPGSNLEVSGSGYGMCGTVYFYFAGTRVGSARPDNRGDVTKGGLSVPGDADIGQNQVTSSCRPSHTQILRSASFDVQDVSGHRAAFATSVPEPRHVSTDGRRLALSGALAALLILLLAFPAELFNATLEENYEEVRGWFGLKPKGVDALRGVPQSGLFFLFLLVGAGLYGLLSPDFGINRTSLGLMLGLVLALVIICIGFSVPTLAFMWSRYRERGRLRVLPGTILVAVACVVISRVVHFQPGYLYGLLVVFLFSRELDDRTRGRLTAVSASFILAVSLAAWAIRVPVSTAAGRPGAGLLVLSLDAALTAVFLLGLESLVVSLLPLRFLDGSKLRAWNRAVWALLFWLGIFVLIHVLLSPGSGYVAHTPAGSALLVIILYVGFGSFSVGFWAYFRYRKPPAGSRAEGMTIGLSD